MTWEEIGQNETGKNGGGVMTIDGAQSPTGQEWIHQLFEMLLELSRREGVRYDLVIPVTGAPTLSEFMGTVNHILSTYDPQKIQQITCGILLLASKLCRSLTEEMDESNSP